EVKTRAGDSFGTPKCGVDSRKKRHIVSAAQSYLQENRIEDCLVRFDVVSIEHKGGGYDCEIVKDAFDEDA
ncbi:MAG: YraN family protein, partial [Deltaproteobacteria bacterium]